jgi:hypothetical protein
VSSAHRNKARLQLALPELQARPETSTHSSLSAANQCLGTQVPSAQSAATHCSGRDTIGEAEWKTLSLLTLGTLQIRLAPIWEIHRELAADPAWQRERFGVSPTKGYQ